MEAWLKYTLLGASFVELLGFLVNSLNSTFYASKLWWQTHFANFQKFFEHPSPTPTVPRCTLAIIKCISIEDSHIFGIPAAPTTEILHVRCSKRNQRQKKLSLDVETPALVAHIFRNIFTTPSKHARQVNSLVRSKFDSRFSPARIRSFWAADCWNFCKWLSHPYWHSTRLLLTVRPGTYRGCRRPHSVMVAKAAYHRFSRSKHAAFPYLCAQLRTATVWEMLLIVD